MSWRIRIALCLVFIVGVALAVPLTRVPAGDVCLPPVDRCGKSSTYEIRLKKKVPMLLVNSRKIRLNYNITDIGPSGVSAVELWATRDGRTWQRYSNEPPPAGPLVVHVAEEGRYGFSIVARSGTGMKSPAPQAGDAPQVWVEGDEPRPVVKIKDVHPGTGRDVATLYVHFTAADVHLTPRPVSISMATKKDGPWTTIASGLENTGVYGWEMPKDLPYQFYVRVEAEDRAGNVGLCCTAEPIKVDLSRPRGTILGVDAAEKKPGPAPKPIEGFFIGVER